MPNPIINRRVVLSKVNTGSAYDTDAQIWFDRLQTLGYPAPSDTMKGYCNTFFLNLKTGLVNGFNNFPRIIRLIWEGSEYEEHWPVSLVYPTSTLAEAVNGLPWTQFLGNQGNGIDQYMNLHFNPSTDGGSIFTQNDAGLSVYSLTDFNGFKCDMGCFNAAYTAGAGVDIREADQFFTFLNDNGSGATGIANTTSIGFFTEVRVDASTINVYKDGVFLGTKSRASSALPNAEMFGNARGDSGVPYIASTRQTLCKIIHKGDIDVADLNAAVQLFATQIGAI